MAQFERAKVTIGDEEFHIRRVPRAPESLYVATAVALRPSDDTAAVLRSRELWRAVDEIRGAEAAPPNDGTRIKELAELLNRPFEVHQADPPACEVVLPREYIPNRRIPPVVLLVTELAGDWNHYDVVEARRPAMLHRMQPRRVGVVPLGPNVPEVPDPIINSQESGISQRSAARQRSPSPQPSQVQNQRLIVATWNAQGVAALGVKDNVDAELYSRGVHVAVLQETKIPPQQLITQHYRWVVEGAPLRGARGLALLVRRDLPYIQLISHTLVCPDVMIMEVSAYDKMFSVIATHVPGDVNPRQLEVSAAVAAAVAARPHHRCILLGDFNAHLGQRDRNGPTDVLGKGTPYVHSNMAGVGLLQIARIHHLRIITTAGFARGCQTTWIGGGLRGGPRAARSQLDHICTNFSNVNSVNANFATQVSADHKIVYATLMLHLPEPDPPGRHVEPDPDPAQQLPRHAARKPRIPWALGRLNEEVALQELYQGALTHALEQLENRFGNLSWKQVAEAMETAANAQLRVQESPMTPRRREAANRRRHAYTLTRREPGDEFAEELLREATLAEKRASRRHAEEKIEQFFREVDGVRPANKLNVAFRYLKKEKRQQAPQANNITMRDCEEVVQRMAEGEHPDRLPEDPGGPITTAPTAAQLREYASKLSKRTAAGPDGLPGELFIHGPPKLFQVLEKVVGEVWRAGEFPAASTQSMQHPIPKKARPAGVDDYRTLSLCNTIYKLVAKHMMVELTTVLPPIPYYQAGFRASRSTYDHLFLLRRVLDAHWQAGSAVHVMALDIKAAFPSVNKKQMVRILQEMGVSAYLINRIIALALTDVTFIRYGKAMTSTVLRGREVRQGCPISPYLFTLALHWAIARAVARLHRFSLDITRPGLLPAVCAYADDILVVSDRFRDLVAFLTAFRAELPPLTLEIKFAKSEYLFRKPAFDDPEPIPRPIAIGDVNLQQVEKIIYLGAAITNQLDRRPIIKHRIQKTQRSAAVLLNSLRRHPLPISVIKRFHTSIILPATNYELATVSSTKATRSKLRRENAIIYKSLLATARPPHVVIPANDAPSVNRSIRAARIMYRGHILRTPPGHPLRLAYDLNLGLKQGRPCYDYVKSLEQDMDRLPEPPEGWAELLLNKIATKNFLKETRDQDYSSEEEVEEEEDEEDNPGEPQAVHGYRQVLEAFSEDEVSEEEEEH
ncbi:uncharacterized protein LOC127751707 [Frankliniella occidentalis]|uniref:Uncharacterized protein LOC127751707 n=1 Tax=Frankliniella occidentalis TaxID=133901 RepID=A0A9C6XUJ0_FRAOC|nr:uncharacterized protein LOC127751707 [Frankliniella occidentalis]